MKNSIIFLGLPLLFSAFMLSCQQQESSPVSPEESFTLDKKGGKPSVEYIVDCVLGTPPPGGYNSPTVVTDPLSPGTVHENLKSVKWEPNSIEITPLGSEDALSGEVRMNFNKKGGKIVSFQFWIWKEGYGWEGPPYTTGEVDLTTPFEPSEGSFTVPLELDNLPLYKKVRKKIVEVIGTISFGDVVFTPKP